jgi:hypothetical protein
MLGALLGIVLAFALIGVVPSRSDAQDAVLEHYSITVGHDAVGVRAEVFDRYFGHGTAKSRLVFVGPASLEVGDDPACLSLHVWRHVPPGTIAFALLVFGIEIHGYDADGAHVYSRHVRGFTFADSASGDWHRILRPLPPGIRQIDVIFFGNYE